MIFQHITQGLLIICIISELKSEELLNSIENKNAEQPTIRAKKGLNSTDIESLSVSANKAEKSAVEDLDFISLSLENFATTSTNLQDTSSLSTSTIANDLKDKETTSSWELIYPEQNSSMSTSTAEPSLSSSNDLSVTNSFKATALPKYFKVDDVINCKKFFGQCLNQVLTTVVPKLKSSNQSPSLDPLYFNATAFQYNSGPFTGYITIRYALVYGLTTIRFKNVDFYNQDEKFKARLTMLVPKMSVIGAYKGDLHVNNVRVRPRGDFNVSMTTLGLEMLSLGNLYKRDDHTFLKFTKANATTTLKDSKINATGIFPDQRLNDIVVNVVNQYWRDLFNVVLPETRNNWLPILLDTLNAALEMVPFDFFNITS